MFIEQNELSPEDVESLRKPSQCLRLKKKNRGKKPQWYLIELQQ